MDKTMMSDFMGRLDVEMEFKHDYPQVPITTVLSTPTKPVLVLDLTNNGISNGIAMSQFRVWEIETIIHPFGCVGVGSQDPRWVFSPAGLEEGH